MDIREDDEDEEGNDKQEPAVEEEVELICIQSSTIIEYIEFVVHYSQDIYVASVCLCAISSARSASINQIAAYISK